MTGRILLVLLVGLVFTPTAHAGSVYVTSSTASGISEFDGAFSGLTPLTPATVATGANPYNPAVSPDQASVYVPVISGAIYEYDRNLATGVLTAKSSPSISTGDATSTVAVSSDGNNLYATNRGGNTIGIYSIGSGGILSAVGTVATGSNPESLVVSPDGSSVYAVNRQSGTISQYDRNAATGLLTAKTPATVAAGSQPFAIAITKDGKYVYVADPSDNAPANGSVRAFAVTAGTGVLVLAGTEPTFQGPNGIATSPDNKFVYATTYRNNQVVAYSIDAATGALTLVGGYGTDSTPVGVAVSPGSRSVYTANQSGNSVSQFSIGATGALTAKTPASQPVAGGPRGVVTAGSEAATAVRWRGGQARVLGRAGGVRISWRTGADADDLGFRVLRQRRGKRMRVTRRLIPGGAVRPVRVFSVRDRRGRTGDRYFVISRLTDGSRRVHGPITAK